MADLIRTHEGRFERANAPFDKGLTELSPDPGAAGFGTPPARLGGLLFSQIEGPVIHWALEVMML
jgi:hypothetical protein